MWRVGIFVLLSLLPCSVFSQPTAQPTAELISVRKIWDQATHNAFTDLIRFQGQWYCVFREGASHVSDDGALRVIRSAAGVQWQSAVRIASSSADYRDAKITITPDQQLMLSGAAALNDSLDYKHQPMVWFSDDGRNWTRHHHVGDRDFWLWRITWHKSVAWGFGYGTREDNRSIRLYRSDDGKSFETVVHNAFAGGYANETSLVFRDDDTCLCLLRRDGQANTAQLGFSQPPYQKWQWKDLGERIGGPHMIALPNGQLIAAVRLYDGGPRTALCWIDTEQGGLHEILELPSGGDTSYAGLVWHDERLWISYYSSHEGKSSIYLAQVRIGE